MGRITSLLLAATALIAASPAAAQTWRIASTGGTAPGRSVYFVDLSSIQRTGSTVIFTTSTIFEGITADRDWDRSVTKRKGDCTAKSSQILQNTFFDGGTENRFQRRAGQHDRAWREFDHARRAGCGVRRRHV
jgi:hypothetical protein